MADEEKKHTELERAQAHALVQLIRGERLLVGAVVFGAFGLAAYAMWLLAKRQQMQPQLGLFGPQPAPPHRMLGAMPAQLPPGLPAAYPATNPTVAPPMQTAMLTLTLPTERVQRIWQPPVQSSGPVRYWRVVVRNIGPAGSFAYLSMDSGMSPVNSVQIPSGIAGFHEFQMGPSQILFGRGDVAGVEITLSASG